MANDNVKSSCRSELEHREFTLDIFYAESPLWIILTLDISYFGNFLL